MLMVRDGSLTVIPGRRFLAKTRLNHRETILSHGMPNGAISGTAFSALRPIGQYLVFRTVFNRDGTNNSKSKPLGRQESEKAWPCASLGVEPVV